MGYSKIIVSLGKIKFQVVPQGGRLQKITVQDGSSIDSAEVESWNLSLGPIIGDTRV